MPQRVCSHGCASMPEASRRCIARCRKRNSSFSRSCKPAKQNEEGCVLPRILYTVGFSVAGQLEAPGHFARNARKKRRSQERRSKAGGDACESNTPETFCAPRNGFEGREVHQEPIHLHMSVASTVKPSKHSTQFSRGADEKSMRSRKARKRGPRIDAAKAFAGCHRAS